MFKKHYVLDLKINLIIYSIIVFYLTSCSFDKRTEINDIKSKPILEKKKIIVSELNANLKLILKDISNNDFFEYKIINTKKYKFKKIKNFTNSELKIKHIKDGGIIFFDGSGNIFRLDSELKELWKVNFYSKKEKKLNPKLYFGIKNNYLIIVDTISKIFAININTGELIYVRENNSPFNSNIILSEKYFFVIDFNNTLKCFEIETGKEIWNFKSDDTFIKSKKKLSLILENGILYFNNTIGDLTAVNPNDGSLIWQTPTQDSSIFLNSFSLKNSDLNFSKNKIYFSNNFGEFFSIDAVTGIINWTQKINSVFKPIYVDNLVITLTENGYFYVIDDETGNVIRITNIFNDKKNKHKLKIKNFILLNDKILASINSGALIYIDIQTAFTKDLKVKHMSKEFNSTFYDGSLYLFSNSSIIKNYL